VLKDHGPVAVSYDTLWDHIGYGGVMKEDEESHRELIFNPLLRKIKIAKDISEDKQNETENPE
jgi:hypothetical protein